MGAAMVAQPRREVRDRDEDPSLHHQGDEAAEEERVLATTAAHAAIDETVQQSAAAAPARDDDVDAKAPAEAAAAEAGERLTLGGYGHIWLRGDTLWDVSQHYYGDGRQWPKIKAANVEKFRRGVREGDVLDIPAVDVDTLSALLRFKDQPEELRTLVVLMPADQYEGFFAGLTKAQIDKHGEFLQVLELMRATGKTVKELGEEQREWLKEEAAKDGKDVGAAVGETVEREGYGGSPTPIWDGTSPKDRRAWKARWEAAVKRIKASAPDDVQEIIKDAEANGGGFRWSPQDVERHDAFAYTTDQWDLHCGFEWVAAAENDPASVHGNIAHEMGGHNYYGQSLGHAVQITAMTAKEEQQAETSGNSIYSAYGYMETEIFAELYEYPYNFPDSDGREYPSDTAFDTDKDGRPVKASRRDPLGDVYGLLKRMRDSFAPGVGRGLVASLARRVSIDPRITPDAKERFQEAVLYVFVSSP